MDQQSFDRLTAALAAGTGRRHAVTALLAGTAAVLGLGGIAEADAAKKRKRRRRKRRRNRCLRLARPCTPGGRRCCAGLACEPYLPGGFPLEERCCKAFNEPCAADGECCSAECNAGSNLCSA